MSTPQLPTKRTHLLQSRSPSPKRQRLEPEALRPFELIQTDGRARRGRLALHHGVVETPAFMPVGTQGTIKMIPAEVMDCLGPQLILGNTYHLGNRPGHEQMSKIGGLHKFMNWGKNLLTDSGGFQMVSLLSLATIREEGVEFCHPRTNEKMILTPEESIKIQNAIGADVMMALDDVVSAVGTERERVEEALHRTTRWLDRCIKAHKKPMQRQHLWGIVQGGLHPDLRIESMRQLKERDLPGYAIGGLSGGEAKSDFWNMVEVCSRSDGEGLPVDRSRYLMGVGYPLDIIVCVALGCDLFDCVYPTRTARFGSALSDSGVIRVKRKQYENDFTPLDDQCDCDTCAYYTRAFLHRTVGKQASSLALLTQHNLRYMHNLGVRMRKAIEGGKFKNFINEMILAQEEAPPVWMRDALVAAGMKDAADWIEWKEEETKCGAVPHHVPHKSSMETENRKGDVGKILVCPSR